MLEEKILVGKQPSDAHNHRFRMFHCPETLICCMIFMNFFVYRLAKGGRKTTL